MLRSLYILSLFFFLSAKVTANYVHTPLHKLIKDATWIVSGTIIGVEEETFTIAVAKRIKGENTQDTIKIRKFYDWTCASRYAAYKTGQQAIYFLTTDEKTGLPKTIGAANEGELITDGKRAYVKDTGKQFKGSKIIKSFSPYTPYASFDISTVSDGIRIYLENYESIEKELNHSSDGKVVYQYSYIEHLPKNDFLLAVIDEKKNYYRHF